MRGAYTPAKSVGTYAPPAQLGDRARAIANAQAALKIFVEIEDPNTENVRRKLAEWAAPNSE